MFQTYFGFGNRTGVIGYQKYPVQITNSSVQAVVRVNRDTLYGYGLFDLNYESVTINLPAVSAHLYHSFYIISNDQFSLAVIYPNANYKSTVTIRFCAPTSDDRFFNKCHTNLNGEFDRKKQTIKYTIYSPTRYISTITRTLADPHDPSSLQFAWGLQNATYATPQKNPGTFAFDLTIMPYLVAARTSYAKISPFVPPALSLNGFQYSNKYGYEAVDPVAHHIGSAVLWGGLPFKDAFYEIVFPPAYVNNSGVAFTITVDSSKVPIEANGFWSVTVYNAVGFIQYNQYAAYSFNSLTAIPDETRGSIYTIHFSQNPIPNVNWIEIFPGWNYMIRLYKPLPAVLSGAYTFPSLVQTN